MHVHICRGSTSPVPTKRNSAAYYRAANEIVSTSLLRSSPKRMCYSSMSLLTTSTSIRYAPSKMGLPTSPVVPSSSRTTVGFSTVYVRTSLLSRATLRLYISKARIRNTKSIKCVATAIKSLDASSIGNSSDIFRPHTLYRRQTTSSGVCLSSALPS